MKTVPIGDTALTTASLQQLGSVSRVGEGAEQMHLVDAAPKIRTPEQAESAEPRCAGRQHHPVAPQAGASRLRSAFAHLRTVAASVRHGRSITPWLPDDREPHIATVDHVSASTPHV